jgi:hypothetical protein
METVLAAWIIGSLILAAIYGLHRLGLYLERRGWIYYLHSPPAAGGSAYNPLQEIVQPQIRHVAQVGEQRHADDDAGAPPVPLRPELDRAPRGGAGD